MLRRGAVEGTKASPQPVEQQQAVDEGTRELLLELLQTGHSPRIYVEFSPSNQHEVTEVTLPQELPKLPAPELLEELLARQGEGELNFGICLPKTPDGEQAKLVLGGVALDIAAIGGQSVTLGVPAAKLVKWLALPPLAQASGSSAPRPYAWNGVALGVAAACWLLGCLGHAVYRGRNLAASAQALDKQVLDAQLQRNLANIPVPLDSPLYDQYQRYWLDQYQQWAAQLPDGATRSLSLGVYGIRVDWHVFRENISSGALLFCAGALLYAVARLFSARGGAKDGDGSLDKLSKRAAPQRSAATQPEAEVPEASNFQPNVDGVPTAALSPSVEPQLPPTPPPTGEATALPPAAAPDAASQQQGLPVILEGPNGEPMVVTLPMPQNKAAAEGEEPTPLQTKIDYGASPQRQKLQRKIAARERGQLQKAQAQAPQPAPTPEAGDVAQPPQAASRGEDDPLSDETAVEALLRELEDTPKASKKKRHALQRQPTQGQRGAKPPPAQPPAQAPAVEPALETSKTPEGTVAEAKDVAPVLREEEEEDEEAAAQVAPRLSRQRAAKPKQARLTPEPPPAEPATKELAAKEPTAKELVAKESAAKELAAKEPAAKELVAKEPAAKELAAKEPPAKELVAKEPAAKELAAKEPAAKELVAKEPAAKELATKEPAAKELVAKEPVAKELATKEPAAKELVAKEPAAKEQAAKELVAKEPAAKEPPTKDSTREPPALAAKELVAKEPAAKEPPTKDSTTREPLAKTATAAPAPPRAPKAAQVASTPAPEPARAPQPVVAAGNCPATVSSPPPAAAPKAPAPAAEVGGDWDIALRRSAKRRTRTSGDTAAPASAADAPTCAAVAPAAAATTVAAAVESKGKAQAKPPSAQPPATEVKAAEASPPQQPPAVSAPVLASDAPANSEAGAAQAMLEELRLMKKDELLRWFGTNSALGWLNDRLSGAQIMECTPKSVLLDHAALLLGAADAPPPSHPERDASVLGPEPASAPAPAAHTAEQPVVAAPQAAPVVQQPAHAAPQPAPTSPQPLPAAPQPAPTVPQPVPTAQHSASTVLQPAQTVPPQPAPTVPQPAAVLQPAQTVPPQPAPTVPQPPVQPAPVAPSGVLDAVPIRFGDFEERPQQQLRLPAGPPPTAPPPAPDACAAAALEQQVPPQEPGASVVAAAAAWGGEAVQQQPMMPMQPARGMALVQCMPPLGYLQGQQGATQAPQLCALAMPEGAGSQPMMQFVPIMPAVPGATALGQQGVHQQFIPVMFALPYNPVSPDGGAAAAGMLMPAGDFGSAPPGGAAAPGMLMPHGDFGTTPPGPLTATPFVAAPAVQPPSAEGAGGGAC